MRGNGKGNAPGEEGDTKGAGMLPRGRARQLCFFIGHKFRPERCTQTVHLSSEVSPSHEGAVGLLDGKKAGLGQAGLQSTLRVRTALLLQFRGNMQTVLIRRAFL